MNQKLTLVIASNDHGTLEELRAAFTKDDRIRVLATNQDVQKLHTDVARLRPLACVIALDGASSNSSHETIRHIASEFPETVIICASRGSAPDLILSSLRAGAREFLRLPVDADELKTVLDRTAEFCTVHGKSNARRGRAIAVFSNKGGSGTSLIATNLAAAMGAPTALVDLNLQAGDLDLYLGAKSKFSIVDVVGNRARMDDSLLASYLINHNENLALLAAPSEALLAEDIKSENVFEVIELLQRRYEYVIADLPHTFDSVALAALDQADDILLVLTLDLPSIRNAQRSLAIFDRLNYTRKKVRIVVNRWSKQIDLDLPQVERFLGEKVVAFIQSDYRAAVNSINLGRPLVEFEPSSIVSSDIRKLAATISGTPETASARKGLLGSIFRRQPASTQMEIRSTLGQSIDGLQRSES